MHRFYLPPEQAHEPSMMLAGREAHHGLRVLRVRKGEEVTVLDGEGHSYLCEVAELGRDVIRLAVLRKDFVEALPYQITLVQAIPKGKIFDSIIQKTTELGAFRIVPLLSERVVTQLNDDKSESRVGHWRMVAIEAIKQCGSAWLPRIGDPATPRELLACGETSDLFLIGSLEKNSRHPREYFQQFAKARNQRPKSICVWVGPEGDFSPGEIAASKKAGAMPISLGRLVLRSETAAVYCMSVLNYELQSASS